MENEIVRQIEQSRMIVGMIFMAFILVVIVVGIIQSRIDKRKGKPLKFKPLNFLRGFGAALVIGSLAAYLFDVKLYGANPLHFTALGASIFFFYLAISWAIKLKKSLR